ncbi:MAG: tetratricopeptide repeat protein [Spirochaetaceae bacterium]|nr:tetratricopeptide repeat protein [Spirochaetaceae bacterium]
MVKVIRLVLILSLTWLSGCNAVAPAFLVLSGNYRFEQGRYHEAVAAYFRALEFNRQSERIYFNLGNVYDALGEAEAALEMWRLAETSDNYETRSKALFNQGVMHFRLEQFDEAVSSFIAALMANPNDFNAKINLELALFQRGAERAGEIREANSNDLSSEQERMLDFLRRQEAHIWLREGGNYQWQDENDW